MPPLGIFGRFLGAIGLTVFTLALATSTGEASPAAGTAIANTATLSYADTHGAIYTVQSNTIVVSVAAVSAVAVSPKETAVDPVAEGYPVGGSITRTFTVTNAGNVPDAYTVSAFTGGGTIASIVYLTGSGAVPVTQGATVTPTLPVGGSIQVQLSIVTTGVAVGATFPITLTARSTNTAVANGLVTDSGRMWAIAQRAASIAGPGGPNTVVTKLVNNVRTHPAQPGETVTYTISFKNYGGSPATNVVLIDKVPVGIVALTQTVTLNGTSDAGAATLNGQTLSVKIGTLAPGAAETLTFDAQVQQTMTAGAVFVNIATLQADGIAQIATTPASVLVGLANIVYDGYAGGKSPIPGAILTLRDFATKAIVPLVRTGTGSSSLARSPLDALIGVPSTGLAPNTSNANPFITGSDGAYTFVFEQSQLGTPTNPAVYELDVSAPAYRDRRIQLTITPDATGLLYNVTLHDIDDQMVAIPGGFTLTANTVSLAEVFGLLGNIPMFAPHPVAVTKTVDRDVASGGDRLVYTVQFGSAAGTFGATRVVDTLPAGVVYAPGTARVDGLPLEPVRDGRTLTWTFANLTSQHTIVYACVVMPDAADGATLVNVVDVGAQSAGGITAGGSASADTRVIAGALGNRIVLTGRVFVDLRHTGRFRDGDRGVGSVRIYLEDGESVMTDKDGRFTFPAVHPGQHVLRVDATTLPTGVRAYDDRRYDSAKSLTRLVHGLYDSGLMQDVNFAVEPVG